MPDRSRRPGGGTALTTTMAPIAGTPWDDTSSLPFNHTVTQQIVRHVVVVQRAPDAPLDRILRLAILLVLALLVVAIVWSAVSSGPTIVVVPPAPTPTFAN